MDTGRQTDDAWEDALALIKENDDTTLAQYLLGALDERHPGLVKLWASLKAGAGEKELTSVRLRTVSDFLQEVGTPPAMLIEGHLPDKSLFILAGKPKHCKSFVALSVAMEIARAQKAFGRYAISRPGSVVYLAMEDGEYEVANRLLIHRQGNEENPPLHFCTEGFRIATEDSVRELAELIRPLNPVMLVIDTATEALGIRKWEDRGEVSQKLRPLRELIARQVCSVLLVAHNRKADGESGDEIAGSNAFTGAVDGWWSIYKKVVQSSGNVLLHYRREGRGGVRGEGVLEMDTHTLQVTALGDAEVEGRLAEVAPASKPEAAQKAILTFLEDGVERKTDEILKAMRRGGIGENSVREALHELAEKGKLRTGWRGRSGSYQCYLDDVLLEDDHQDNAKPALTLVEDDPFSREERSHNLDAFQ